MQWERPTTLAMLTRLGENAPDVALAIVASFGISFATNCPTSLLITRDRAPYRLAVKRGRKSCSGSVIEGRRKNMDEKELMSCAGPSRSPSLRSWLGVEAMGSLWLVWACSRKNTEKQTYLVFHRSARSCDIRISDVTVAVVTQSDQCQYSSDD